MDHEHDDDLEPEVPEGASIETERYDDADDEDVASDVASVPGEVRPEAGEGDHERARDDEASDSL